MIFVQAEAAYFIGGRANLDVKERHRFNTELRLVISGHKVPRKERGPLVRWSSNNNQLKTTITIKFLSDDQVKTVNH